MYTRRIFGSKVLMMSALVAFPSGLRSEPESSNEVELRLAAGPATEIPPDFTGLGYEMLSVSTPGLLSTTNTRYLELIKGLGPQGVLRVGGIVANYTRYAPVGISAFEPKNTVITRQDLERFGQFLRAINWKTIWSVNFAKGSIEDAVKEALAVSEVLGSRLLAIEIGNEVENYGKGQPFRKSPYTYEEYRKEFEAWRTAITGAVPGIRFAAPDTAASVEWVEHMAQDAKGEVDLLTTHYYRNGQRRGSAEQLLTPDPRLEDVMTRMRAASQQSGIPWRICEMNSFSGGGLPGVSDTFLGALWTLNIMLLLAQSGCAGVNMETGVNQLGFVSSYSPVQDDGHGTNSAGVPYYGMLAFAQAFSGAHQMLPLAGGEADPGFSAYVLGAAGKPRSAVALNLTTGNRRISVARMGMNRASVLRLTAPAADSKSGVTFGGAAVDSSGRWKAALREEVRDGSVLVPGMSAALIRADHE